MLKASKEAIIIFEGYCFVWVVKHLLHHVGWRRNDNNSDIIECEQIYIKQSWWCEGLTCCHAPCWSRPPAASGHKKSELHPIGLITMRSTGRMKMTLGALYISRYQCCLLKDNTLHRCIVNPPWVHPIAVPPVGVPPPLMARSADHMIIIMICIVIRVG